METCYTTQCASPLGILTLASDGESLTGLWMEDQKYHGGTMKGEPRRRDDLPVFAAAKAWLGHYFSGQKPAAGALPLAPNGSAFRKMVWGILSEIPYGQYVTYGEIGKRVAAQMQRPGMSGQAVGGAVGLNPISIIIPCHRVVGAGGSLTGYAGGIEKKIKLLKHEGADMAGLYVPARSTAP